MSYCYRWFYICIHVYVYEFLFSLVLVAVLDSLSSCEGHYFMYNKQSSEMSDRAFCRVGSICGMGCEDGTVGSKGFFSIYNIEKEKN